MKKLIFALVFALIIVNISGCSSDVSSLDGSKGNLAAYNDASCNDLEVHFIDVGQGDAILLTCGDESMLIDGGSPEESNTIYTYLKNNNIDYLKYIIATHPDDDHAGGLSGALNYADVGGVYCSELTHDTRAFNNFLKNLDNKGLTLLVPENETSLSLGSAEITLYVPDKAGDLDDGSNSDDTNANSIVTRVENGDASLLLLGDASKSETKEFLDKYDLKSDVLKVSHHGSQYSTDEEIIQAIEPEIAVISCGAYNDYGHPADKVLDIIKYNHITLYRTDLNGDIILSTSGAEFTAVCQKTTSNPFEYYSSLYLHETEETSKETTPIQKEQTSSQSSELTYVINKSSKKFHYPNCSSVKTMSDKNKETVTASRDDLIAEGYSPCNNCHP